jgi:F5/8 type C domain
MEGQSFVVSILRRIGIRFAGSIAALSLVTIDCNTGAAQDSAKNPVYPEIGPTTHLLDHDALIAGFAEPGWYKANIPFIDLPDKEIQEVYYYRWRTAHEAQKYTGGKNGWISTEFLGPIAYAAPNGGISAAAGHHIAEGRWIRDTRYLDDYIQYWLVGDGSGPKPAEDGVNKNTTDWAHEYSFWAATAVLDRAKVTGDFAFATKLLPQLIKFYNTWSPQYNSQLGLYWQTPVWDAMELSASSYQSSDPYHGGDGYRPTINAYQFGDAQAISTLAILKGDLATSVQFTARAKRLQQAQDHYLWDPTTSFYKHVMRDNNSGLVRLIDREEIGFVPWMFHMPGWDRSSAWSQLLDPQGFYGEFGPTTVERRSPWFMFDAAAGCCHWDGPMWPYAASQTLTGLANLLIDYPPQPYVTKNDYYSVLSAYAFAQQKNGQPYVAEAHDSDNPVWIYDSFNHSEDYNHSTFNDLVLSGLLGIRPQLSDTIIVHPLVPDSWDYFAIEDLPYHGRNLTVLWDRDGSHYHQGAGLRIYIDGQLTLVRERLQPVQAVVPPNHGKHSLPRLVNDAVNAFGGPTQPAEFPKASASFTSPYDDPQRAIDGENFYLDIPNTRWTSYTSPNPQDWWSVDFGQVRQVHDIRIYFYNDNGGVKTPVSYQLQYQTSSGDWLDIPSQVRDPVAPAGNDLNRITFDSIQTRALRVIVTPQPGSGAGITEFQSWR